MGGDCGGLRFVVLVILIVVEWLINQSINQSNSLTFVMVRVMVHLQRVHDEGFHQRREYFAMSDTCGVLVMSVSSRAKR